MVTTDNGLVQGFTKLTEGQNVSVFLGIPFAEPPIGSRRFGYPEAYAKRWSGVRPAMSLSNMCLQRNKLGGHHRGNEDCLYLNVFTPRKAIGQATLLPVMFWIFGGAYVDGDGCLPLPWPLLSGECLYDGSRLAGRHDVVLVTHNYRLSALGFNTYTKGKYGETGTQAMADQRLALAWTQANIREFGGDPARVTIFGESAGAFSAVYHLVSPPSWQFFSKVVLQSGTTDRSWFFQPKDNATDMFEGWAASAGCPKNAEQLQCLQSRPMEVFVEPPKHFTGPRSSAYPRLPVGPVVDGTEHGLLDVPGKLIQAGRFSHVPLILGANKDGGSVFEVLLSECVPGLNHIEAMTKEDEDRIAAWGFSAENRSSVETTYLPSEYSSAGLFKYQRLVEHVMRDMAGLCPLRRMASVWRSKALPVYLYVFSFDFGTMEKMSTLGDFHGVDLAFTWRAVQWLPAYLLSTIADMARLSDIMACLWTSFAYSGSPNSISNEERPTNCSEIYRNLTSWPSYDDQRLYYSLQATKSTGPKVGKLRAANKYPDDEFPSDVKCDMWDTMQYPWHPFPDTMLSNGAASVLFT